MIISLTPRSGTEPFSPVEQVSAGRQRLRRWLFRLFPEPSRNLTRQRRTQPSEYSQNRAQERSIGAKTIYQAPPVEPLVLRIDHVEHIRPVAAVLLQDVELGPDHFLRWHHSKSFTGDGDLWPAHNPGLIDVRLVIGHRKDHVHNGLLVDRSIDPGAIVGKLVVIIDQTGPI